MVGRFFQLIIWFDRDFSSAPSGLAKSSPLIQGRRAARLPLATVFRAFGAHLTFEAKLYTAFSSRSCPTFCAKPLLSLNPLPDEARALMERNASQLLIA